MLDVESSADASAELFGDSLELARRYAQMLATTGVERGLIGPRERDRLWERHLLNCAVVAELLPATGELVDIGSGAGLPGVVFAMLRRGLRVVLLEPMLRRTQFLTECVTELGLDNARVVRARAEDAAGDFRADVVTARAVAPLNRLAGLAIGLVRPGGTILAIKGERAETELAEARPVLSGLGVRSAEVIRVGHGRVEQAATVVRIVAGDRGREERFGARGSRPGVA